MILSPICTAVILLLHLASGNQWDLHDQHLKHDFKLSFKKPFFYPNKTQNIPYFKTSSTVLKTHDWIRLTPSIPDVSGTIWSEVVNPHKAWSVEFSFTAFGRGYMGGKGIAFWYAEDPSEIGPVFGSKDNWKGLGILFSTADQHENRYAPLVYGVINDGRTSVASSRDYNSFSIGSCFRDYRNTPGPVWVRLQYRMQKLTMEMDIRQNGYSYTTCFEKENIDLPTGYHFGLSAQTDHLSDDHDILSFETYEFDPAPRKKDPLRPTQEDHIKKNDEFKMTDALKEKIKKSEENVKQAEHRQHDGAQPDGYQESINVHTIQGLQENQFKIIESLNLINQRLDMPNVANAAAEPGSHQDNAKARDIDNLRRELSDLARRVQELTTIVHEAFSKIINSDTKEGGALHQYVENHMVSLHNKLDAGDEALRQAASKVQLAGGGTHYGMYLLFFFVGIVLMNVIRTLLVEPLFSNVLTRLLNIGNADASAYLPSCPNNDHIDQAHESNSAARFTARKLNGMSDRDFGNLLLSSQSLTAHITAANVLPRALDTIQEQSAQLCKNGKPVVLSRLESLLIPSTITQLPQFTDFSQFQTHQIIANTIKLSRDASTARTTLFFNAKMSANWDKTKQRLFAAPSTNPTSQYSSTPSNHTTAAPITTQMKLFANVLEKLNDSLIASQNYNLIAAFKKISDKSQIQLIDCWQLLSCIFAANSTDYDNKNYQQWYEATHADEGNSAQAIKCRQLFVDGSQSFLQQHFWIFIEKTVQNSRAQVGGMPSVDTLVDAFINVKFKKYSAWQTSTFKTNASDKAIFVHLFYLLRAGKDQSAAEYVRRNQDDFDREDVNFTGYVLGWIENHSLDKKSRDLLLLYWNNLKAKIEVDSTGCWIKGDPFEFALYKIFGRCDLVRKSIPGRDVLPSTEDYIWFHLMLIREETSSIQEKFTLRDCAKIIQNFGAKHFSPAGRSPLTYALVLLLCGEFEQAIAFLYNTETHRINAIHLGIALAYHGTLRVPDHPTDDAIMRPLVIKSVGGYECAFVNFHHMLNQYVRAFSTTNPQEALQYIFAIGLLDKPAYYNEAQKFIVDIIIENMESQDGIERLVGSIRADNVRVPGYIEKYASGLLGSGASSSSSSTSPSDYGSVITRRAGAACNFLDRYVDAIRLYDFAGDYVAVFEILNKRLGDQLCEQQVTTGGSGISYSSRSRSPKRSANTAIPKKSQDLINVARDVLQRCDNGLFQQQGGTTSAAAQRACVMLLQLFEFMNQTRLGCYERAIQIVDELDIVPIRDDAAPRSAAQVLSLNEHVARALPLIIHAYMIDLGSFYANVKQSGRLDAMRLSRLAEIKSRAKALVLFSAHVQYKLPSEVHGLLVTIDAQMN